MFNNLKYELLNLSNDHPYYFDEFRIKCRLRKALAGEFDDIQEVKNLRFKDPTKYDTYKKVYFFVKTLSNITSNSEDYKSRIEIEKQYTDKVSEGFVIISEIINRTINSIRLQKEKQKKFDEFNFNPNKDKTRAEEVYDEMLNYVYDRTENLRKINNNYIKDMNDLSNYINDMYIKNKYQNILRDRELLLKDREKLALDRMKLSKYKEKFLKESEDQLNNLDVYEHNVYDTSNKTGRNNELSSDINNDSLFFELNVHYYIAVCICSFYFTKYITKTSNKFNGAFFSVIKNITKDKFLKKEQKLIPKEENIHDIDVGYQEVKPNYEEPKDLIEQFEDNNIYPIVDNEEQNLEEDQPIQINTDDLNEETINAVEKLAKIRQEENQQKGLTQQEPEIQKFEDKQEEINENEIETIEKLTPILDDDLSSELIKPVEKISKPIIDNNKIPVGVDLLTYISKIHNDNIPLNINLKDGTLLVLLKLSTPNNLNDFKYMLNNKDSLLSIFKHDIFSEDYIIE